MLEVSGCLQEQSKGKGPKERGTGPALGGAVRVGEQDWFHGAADADDDEAYYEQEVRLHLPHVLAPSESLQDQSCTRYMVAVSDR
jgi:hypothetical protein